MSVRGPGASPIIRSVRAVSDTLGGATRAAAGLLAFRSQWYRPSRASSGCGASGTAGGRPKANSRTSRPASSRVCRLASASGANAIAAIRSTRSGRKHRARSRAAAKPSRALRADGVGARGSSTRCSPGFVLVAMIPPSVVIVSVARGPLGLSRLHHASGPTPDFAPERAASVLRNDDELRSCRRPTHGARHGRGMATGAAPAARLVALDPPFAAAAALTAIAPLRLVASLGPRWRAQMVDRRV